MSDRDNEFDLTRSSVSSLVGDLSRHTYVPQSGRLSDNVEDRRRSDYRLPRDSQPISIESLDYPRSNDESLVSLPNYPEPWQTMDYRLPYFDPPEGDPNGPPIRWEWPGEPGTYSRPVDPNERSRPVMLTDLHGPDPRREQLVNQPTSPPSRSDPSQDQQWEWFNREDRTGRFAAPGLGNTQESHDPIEDILSGNTPYAGFLAAEQGIAQAENTLSGRSTQPRDSTIGPREEPLGQSNLIPRAATGLWNVVKSPYEAFLREWERMNTPNPESTSVAERSNPSDMLNVALTPIAGTIPAVASTAAGESTLGIMGGRLAASRLEAAGMPEPMRALRTAESHTPEAAVRAELGGTEFGQVTRGVDGRIRFEISDHEAQINPAWSRLTFPDNPNIRSQPTMMQSLDNVLDHPTLFKAYPELAETTVTIRRMEHVPGGARASYDPVSNSIEVTAENYSWARSALIHEVQHRVQRLERFAGGTNPMAAAREANVNDSSMNRILTDSDFAGDAAANLWSVPQQSAIIQAAKEIWPKFEKAVFGNPNVTLYDLHNWFRREHPNMQHSGGYSQALATAAGRHLYYREAGEVEARMVEARRNMDPGERRRNPTVSGTEYEGQVVGEAFSRDKQTISNRSNLSNSISSDDLRDIPGVYRASDVARAETVTLGEAANANTRLNVNDVRSTLDQMLIKDYNIRTRGGPGKESAYIHIKTENGDVRIRVSDHPSNRASRDKAEVDVSSITNTRDLRQAIERALSHVKKRGKNDG